MHCRIWTRLILVLQHFFSFEMCFLNCEEQRSYANSLNVEHLSRYFRHISNSVKFLLLTYDASVLLLFLLTLPAALWPWLSVICVVLLVMSAYCVTYTVLWYGDVTDNTNEENSSILLYFSKSEGTGCHQLQHASNKTLLRQNLPHLLNCGCWPTHRFLFVMVIKWCENGSARYALWSITQCWIISSLILMARKTLNTYQSSAM